MDVLGHALAIGLASFWVWYVLAVKPPPFLAPITRWVRSRPGLRSWVLCPWCFPVYVAAVLAVLTLPLSWATVPVVLAAAAVAGLIGSVLPDDGEPDAP